MISLLLSVLAAAPVVLQTHPCVDEGALFDRQVALELGAPVLRTPPEGGSELTRVNLRCEEALVVVEVTPATGPGAVRRIDPGGGNEPTRRRTLALATAELISATERPPQVTPAPAVPGRAPLRARTETAAVEPPARAAGPWLFSAQAKVVSFVGPQHSKGLGASVALERAVWRQLAVRAELAVEYAGEREPQGRLWLLGGSASLGPQWRLPVAVPLALGIGARAGLARLAGVPDAQSPLAGLARVGPWWGVTGNARLRLAPVERSGATLGLEAGLVLGSFTGLRSDHWAWGVDGGWLALQAGWELPW